MKIYNFLKSNIVIILLGILLVFISIYPELIFEYKLGDRYKGIDRIVSDDENYYQARGQDIIDGHYSLGNPYIYELKNKPPVQFFLPDFIIAKSLSWTGMNIVQIFFAYDIVFSFLLTVLTYLCFKYLTNSKFTANLGTSLLIFGMFFYFFNRPISPQFVFIFFLSLFIFLIKYIRSNGEKKLYFYGAIVNFGLLFYLYTYYWTFYFVFLFIVGSFYLLKKENKLGLDLFYILGLGTLIGSGYLYQTLLASKIPEYTDTLSRLGMINSHLPSGMAMVLTGTIIAALFAYRYYKTKYLDTLDIFIFSGVVSGIIVVNQHIITGKNLAFTVHYFLPVFYIFFFAVTYLISKLESISTKKTLGLMFVSYAFIFGISWKNVQITTNVFKYLRDFTEIKDKEIYVQNYSTVFDWLNKNTNKEDVVLANEEVSNLIPIYTHNNIFYSRLSNLHFMSDGEVFSRFFINNYFDKKDKEYIIGHFPSLYGTRYSDIYGHDSQLNKVRKVLGMELISLNFYPDESINRVLSIFIEMEKEKYQNLLNKYRLDYIVLDKNKNPNWNLEKFAFLKLQYSNAGIEIYKMD